MHQVQTADKESVVYKGLVEAVVRRVYKVLVVQRALMDSRVLPVQPGCQELLEILDLLDREVCRDRLDPVSYTHLTLPTILRV